jgi:hypothetical protein
MSLKDARETKDAWVFYRLSTGGVLSITYNEPSEKALPKEGDDVGVIATTLSMKALARPQDLVVSGGRVKVRQSLARRR